MDVRRRPFSGSKTINYQPITTIMTENSLFLSYDGRGLISSLEINDGYIKKTFAISRNNRNQITSMIATVTTV